EAAHLFHAGHAARDLGGCFVGVPARCALLSNGGCGRPCALRGSGAGHAGAGRPTILGAAATARRHVRTTPTGGRRRGRAVPGQGPFGSHVEDRARASCLRDESRNLLSRVDRTEGLPCTSRSGTSKSCSPCGCRSWAATRPPCPKA